MILINLPNQSVGQPFYPSLDEVVERPIVISFIKIAAESTDDMIIVRLWRALQSTLNI